MVLLLMGLIVGGFAVGHYESYCEPSLIPVTTCNR